MKNKKKIKQIFLSLLFLSILLLASLLLISYFYPAYKIDSRVEKIEKLDQEKEEEIIGWLKVEGTTIDVPIVYAKDDSSIANIDYDYAWSINNTKTLSNRAIFLSHNILNVSHKPLIYNQEFTGFEPLPAFLYYDFAKENQFIQYTVNGKDYIYRIFSVSIIKEVPTSYKDDSYTKKDLKKYISASQENSYYSYDVDVNEDDAILSLVTCTRFYGPTIEYIIRIDARKLRNLERVKPVKIKKKKSYTKIKNLLEE